ncbi:hypothetical protein LUZ60_009091 [Juncus effusus]|nr:hypothetical protein LUZ60_009091 [Juncus effusus]
MTTALVGALTGSINWLIQVIGEKLVTDMVDQLFRNKRSRDSLRDDINRLLRQIIKANMVLGAAEAQGMRIKNNELILSLVDLQRHVCHAKKMLLELNSCECIKSSTDGGSSSLQVVDGPSRRKFSSLPSISSAPFYFSERSIFPHPKKGALPLSCELCSENRAKRRKFNGDEPSRRNRIGEFINRLSEIGDDVRDTLQLELLGNNSRENQGPNIINWVPMYSCLERNEERDEIAKILISDQYHDGDDNPFILPVVGPRGVGKSHLAAYVYRDERVCNYFDLRVWISLFSRFDLIGVILQILRFVSSINFDGIRDLNTLQEILVVYIEKFERVLIVVNDMSLGGGNELLVQLIKILNQKGNKILVTSNDASVSNMIHARNTIYLKYLDDSALWKLFLSSAFGDVDHNEHENLLPIGREICKRCGRIPIGLHLIGFTLRTYLSVEHWENILRSIKQEKKCSDGIVSLMNVCAPFLVIKDRVSPDVWPDRRLSITP